LTLQPSAVTVDAPAGRAFVLYGDGRSDSNVGMLATRTGVGQGTVGGAASSLGTIAVGNGLRPLTCRKGTSPANQGDV